MTPLEYDKKLVDEFGIEPVDDIDDEIKLAHVRVQLEEIKKFMWRERVELQLASQEVKEKIKLGIDELVDEANRKVSSHRSTIKGLLASVRVLTELKNGLEDKITK